MDGFSQSRPEMPRTLALAAAVLLIGAMFWALQMRQPPEGVVTGVVQDRETGRPLVGAQVWLSRNEDADTNKNSDSGDDGGAVTDVMGGTTAPSGWRESRDDDDSLDAAGWSPGPNGMLQAKAGPGGHFNFPRVMNGKYRIYATYSGHEMEELDVVVGEESVGYITLNMGRVAPHLEFENAVTSWYPGEKPVLALRGLLSDRDLVLKVERTDLDGLVKADAARAAQPSDAYGNRHKLPESLFSRVVELPYHVRKADPEGSFFERITLSPLPPGIYRVDASDRAGKARATGWFRVTRLGLVRKSCNGQILAFVTDMQTGASAPGVSLTLYNGPGGRVLSRTVSSQEGLGRLNVVGAIEESQGVLVAREGESAAAVTLELNSPGEAAQRSGVAREIGEEGTSSSSSQPSIVSYIYTDRPLYRPGAVVDFKGVSRWDRGEGGYTVPNSQPVAVEVRDAQNTLISHLNLQTNDMGSWNGEIRLSDDALTGEYTIKATIGEDTSTGNFGVAAYHKPEYEVKVTFDKDRYVRGDTVVATISAAYYFGAPVSNVKVNCSVSRSADSGGEESDRNTSGGSGHESDSTGAGEALMEREVTLDGSGQARLVIHTGDSEEKPGQSTLDSDDSAVSRPEAAYVPDPEWAVTEDQRYTVEASVNEASGNNVTGKGSVVVGQGEFSLNVTPSYYSCQAGTSVSVDIEAARDSGAPQRDQDIQLDSSYSAWMDGVEKRASLSFSHLKTGADGKAESSITPPKSGLLTLRATAVDAHGNRIRSVQDIWVSGPSGGDFEAHYADLSIVLDRKEYHIGDTARVLINTKQTGPTALVTVEGSSLYHTWTIPLRQKSTALDIPVDDRYAPSVTISVCCIRNKQYMNSTAVLPIDDTRNVLKVLVETDQKRCHPGDTAAITVHTTDPSGHPVAAEVSLGVVDSAIYALREESGSTIGDTFERHQENAVETSDSCERIYLGDVDKGAATIKIRQKFVDTALWVPNIRTGAAGTALVSVKLPDNLTTWRITCVGHTASTAVGEGKAEIVVTKDLLLRVEIPPFLLAGDESTLVALVHNNTSSPFHARVRLNVEGLTTQGATDREVDSEPGVPAKLAWQVYAPAFGNAKVTVTVQAGSLSDGMEQPIPILPHGVQRDVFQAGTLLKHIGKTVTVEAGAIPESTALEIRLAPTVTSAILPAMTYLEEYPYGSTDATVSAFLPDVALARAIHGYGAQPPVNLGFSTQRITHLQDMVRRSLLRLYRFQHDDGGWGWWETGKSELWMTAYATWGIQLARDAGFEINDKALSGGLKAVADLSTKEQKEEYPNLAAIALAAMVLAPANPSCALQNIDFLRSRWEKEPDTETYEALAQITLAAQAMGGSQKPLAEELMRQLWVGCRRMGTLDAWSSRPYLPRQGLAQDSVDGESTAWALLTVEAMAPHDPLLDGIARWLMSQRTADYWWSPNPTALVVMGLAQYMGAAHELDPSFDARVSINGKLVQVQHFGLASIHEPDVLVEIPGSDLKQGKNEVVIDKVGQGRLYFSIHLSQCMAEPRPDPPLPLWKDLYDRVFHPARQALPFTPSGYRVKRVYLRDTSRRGFFWEDSVPTPERIYHPDESIIVRLIIDCIRPGSHLIVEDPIPAGCSIDEVSGDETDHWSNWWTYTDVRDSKIVFFISDLTRGRHEIDYHMQAKVPGSYDIMPATLSGAFDPTLHATGKSARLWVR